MPLENYKEIQSMQRPPFFKSDNFLYWKNKFGTRVKSKDIDIWHIILEGDYVLVARNIINERGKNSAISKPSSYMIDNSMYRDELEAALEGASMPNKTVIIAIVNKAYTEGD
nr:putative nucleotide-diphospho-sugar transferase [Tanacetum cinerariifolium]